MAYIKAAPDEGGLHGLVEAPSQTGWKEIPPDTPRMPQCGRCAGEKVQLHGEIRKHGMPEARVSRSKLQIATPVRRPRRQA
jgi:hypothetical protein